MPATMIRPNLRIQRPVESFEREMVAEPVSPRAKDYWPVVSLLVIVVMVGLSIWAGYAWVLS